MATKKPAAAALAGAVKKQPAAKKAAAPRSSKGSGGWGGRGWNLAQDEVKRAQQRSADAQNRTHRFWLKDGETKRFAFVDGDPYSIREHDFQINNRWGNTKTCLQGTGEACPYCEADNKPYFVSMFTVIDMSEYTGRDGKVYKNTIKLFPAKSEALKILLKLREKRGDLAGCMFDASRAGDKSPKVGNMFDFVKKVNLSDPKVYKALGMNAAPKPIDYEAKLAPLSREAALAWLGGNSAGADDEGGDDDIPF